MECKKYINYTTFSLLFRNFAENCTEPTTTYSNVKSIAAATHTKAKPFIIMSRITIKDKTFETSIPESEIQQRVKAVADRINSDYEGRTPIFLPVLNGSFIFAADLLRYLKIECEISFVKVASYNGTDSTGHVKHLIGVNTPLEGRDVIIVEDIVDTGVTMQNMLKMLQEHKPKSLEVCTLLMKPEKLTVPLDIKYCAMEIPNDFIVGYGLDYDQFGRNLRDIYTVVDE